MGKFQPGHKLAKGRPKGSVSRKTIVVEETLARMKCDPIEILAKFATGQWEELGYAAPSKTNPAMLDHDLDKKTRSELQLSATKELAQYAAPKRKAVEMTANVEHSGGIIQVPPTAKNEDEWTKEAKLAPRG